MKKYLTFSFSALLACSSLSSFAQSNSEHSLAITGAKNAVVLDSLSYHVNNTQPLPISDIDVISDLNYTNQALFLSLKSKTNNRPLEYFNFKNLSAIDGQIHALWLRNDFSQAINRTFDITGSSIENLKIAVPSEFKFQDYNQCDVIFISYQLKNSDSPYNIIRFSKIEKEDNNDIMKLYTSIPEGCTFNSIDKDRNAFSSENGYIVNFGFNSKKMGSKNILDFSIHASKEGKEHFLPNLETILIKKDLSGLNFLAPSESKFKKSVIAPYYGMNYSATVYESGSYFVGIGFESGKKREWLFTSTEIK